MGCQERQIKNNGGFPLQRVNGYNALLEGL